jgi:hypothetical protein
VLVAPYIFLYYYSLLKKKIGSDERAATQRAGSPLLRFGAALEAGAGKKRGSAAAGASRRARAACGGKGAGPSRRAPPLSLPTCFLFKRMRVGRGLKGSYTSGLRALEGLRAHTLVA